MRGMDSERGGRRGGEEQMVIQRQKDSTRCEGQDWGMTARVDVSQVKRKYRFCGNEEGGGRTDRIG